MAVPGEGDKKMVEFFRKYDDLLVALHLQNRRNRFLDSRWSEFIYLFVPVLLSIVSAGIVIVLRGSDDQDFHCIDV